MDKRIARSGASPEREGAAGGRRRPEASAPERAAGSTSAASAEAEPALCEGCDSSCERFAEAALRGEGISVGYGERVIIEPMDVAVPAGRVTAVIGPNGCGKSTLLKALARTIPLRGGAVYLNGQAIAELPTVEVARQMALLPQSPQAPGGLTVGELVAYGRYPHQRGLGRLTRDDRAIIDWALALTHLDAFADRSLDALSGGQRQRAWIAMALAQDTGLILLDEPTTYLDLSTSVEVLRLVRGLKEEAGRTVVMVLHDLNLAARYADRLVLLSRFGAVAASGTPEEVLTEARLAEVFDLDSVVMSDPVSGGPLVVPR